MAVSSTQNTRASLKRGYAHVPVPVSVLEERQLDLDEKPLVVQLNWNKDDREGRFVLKNENDVLPKVSQSADVTKLKQFEQDKFCHISTL